MPKFKFSETSLPAWAKGDKSKESSGAPQQPLQQPAAVSAKPEKVEGGKDGGKPKGRWAQRAESKEGSFLPLIFHFLILSQVSFFTLILATKINL